MHGHKRAYIQITIPQKKDAFEVCGSHVNIIMAFYYVNNRETLGDNE